MNYFIIKFKIWNCYLFLTTAIIVVKWWPLIWRIDLLNNIKWQNKFLNICTWICIAELIINYYFYLAICSASKCFAERASTIMMWKHSVALHRLSMALSFDLANVTSKCWRLHACCITSQMLSVLWKINRAYYKQCILVNHFIKIIIEIY